VPFLNTIRCCVQVSQRSKLITRGLGSADRITRLVQGVCFANAVHDVYRKITPLGKHTTGSVSQPLNLHSKAAAMSALEDMGIRGTDTTRSPHQRDIKGFSSGPSSSTQAVTPTFDGKLGEIVNYGLCHRDTPHVPRPVDPTKQCYTGVPLTEAGAGNTAQRTTTSIVRQQQDSSVECRTASLREPMMTRDALLRTKPLDSGVAFALLYVIR
jgi:hypothetical protein